MEYTACAPGWGFKENRKTAKNNVLISPPALRWKEVEIGQCNLQLVLSEPKIPKGHGDDCSSANYGVHAVFAREG